MLPQRGIDLSIVPPRMLRYGTAEYVSRSLQPRMCQELGEDNRRRISATFPAVGAVHAAADTDIQIRVDIESTARFDEDERAGQMRERRPRNLSDGSGEQKRAGGKRDGVRERARAREREREGVLVDKTGVEEGGRRKFAKGRGCCVCSAGVREGHDRRVSMRGVCNRVQVHRREDPRTGG